MPFQFTVYAVILFVVALVLIALAILSWRRRPDRSVLPFVVLLSLIAFWNLAQCLHVSLTNPTLKILASNLTYIGITGAVAAWFIFVLEYTHRQDWLDSKIITLLAVEPVLVLIALFTNPLHYLFYAPREVIQLADGFVTVTSPHEILFWVHAVYSYLLLWSRCCSIA